MNHHRRNLLFVCGTLACAALLGCADVDLPTDTNTDGGTTTDTARVISGVIVAPDSAKRAPLQGVGEPAYNVIIQGTETLDTYTAQTDADGGFDIEIPDDETSDTFTVTLITPDGRPGGPIIFGNNGTHGFTGLQVQERAHLGNIFFPDDPNQEPILPGDDADYDDADVSGEVLARLNQQGVPVGMGNFGRGAGAQGAASNNPHQQGDADQDGLIDIVDADDDGDGTIDDFDPDAVLSPWSRAGVIVNFFMNLKIDDIQATPYFSGDVAGIENSLKTQTVITFEVGAEPTLTRNIVGARIIAPPAPAPPYLPLTTVTFTSPPTLWSSLGYALRPDGPNHFQEWAVPNDFMNTGDVFTVEITFDDGTVGLFTRMINYVFKSIPKLINVGPPGALVPFNGPAEIVFDGTKDIAFEWAPPVDDLGMLLVGLPYRFEIFYYDSTGGQINNIDAATWATPIANWNAASQAYEVPGTSLTTLSASNTFTVQLPKELFPNTVTTATGSRTVVSYKVDIAAQNNGNNAALMLRLRK